MGYWGQKEQGIAKQRKQITVFWFSEGKEWRQCRHLARCWLKGLLSGASLTHTFFFLHLDRKISLLQCSMNPSGIKKPAEKKPSDWFTNRSGTKVYCSCGLSILQGVSLRVSVVQTKPARFLMLELVKKVEFLSSAKFHLCQITLHP